MNTRNAILFLLLTAFVSGLDLGTPLARQHAQLVQLCHFMRGDVRHHGHCCVRCRTIVQGHSEE